MLLSKRDTVAQELGVSVKCSGAGCYKGRKVLGSRIDQLCQLAFVEMGMADIQINMCRNETQARQDFRPENLKAAGEEQVAIT